jgi:hypothetical protein
MSLIGISADLHAIIASPSAKHAGSKCELVIDGIEDKMIAHIKYGTYVLRHKWFVLQAGLSLGVPLSILILHDWDKFLPDEWIPYARYFYGKFPKRDSQEVQSAKVACNLFLYTQEDVAADFDRAWNAHQKRNKHHWQYWCLINDDDGLITCLPMPYIYILEMVADWQGAGLAQGNPDTLGWYAEKRHTIRLHPDTRSIVENLIGFDPETYKRKNEEIIMEQSS